MIEEEGWRIRQVREREAIELARAAAATAAEEARGNRVVYGAAAVGGGSVAAAKGAHGGHGAGRVHGPGGKAAKAAGGRYHEQQRCRFMVLDVDVAVDSGDVYPKGWTSSVLTLQSALSAKGRRLVSVALGAAHTAALTDAGELYTWGWNDHGQLGHGSTRAVPRARAVEALLHAAPHTGGGGANGATSSGGGSLASAASHAATLKRANLSDAPQLSCVRVRRVCAGCDFTVVLAEGGRLYAWGDNRRGQARRVTVFTCLYGRWCRACGDSRYKTFSSCRAASSGLASRRAMAPHSASRPRALSRRGRSTRCAVAAALSRAARTTSLPSASRAPSTRESGRGAGAETRTLRGSAAVTRRRRHYTSTTVAAGWWLACGAPA